MNTIDFAVCIVLLIAVWHGWKQGFILQICSLAGIAVAIWLAARYGAPVGHLLRLDEKIAQPGGFIALLIVVVIAVAILARIIRRSFHTIGFGLADTLLGIGVAVLKYLLVLGALFSAFDALNTDYHLADEKTIRDSKSYAPIRQLTEWALPFAEQVRQQIPRSSQKE